MMNAAKNLESEASRLSVLLVSYIKKSPYTSLVQSSSSFTRTEPKVVLLKCYLTARYVAIWLVSVDWCFSPMVAPTEMLRHFIIWLLSMSVYQVVEFLVENRPDSHRDLAIDSASYGGNLEVVQYLLSKGKNNRITQRWGWWTLC